MNLRRCLVGTLSIGFALACSGLEDLDLPETNDNKGSNGASPEEHDVFNMRVGMCFQDVTGDTVADLPVVDCSQAHDNEVYHLFDVSLSSFSEAGIEAEAERECIRAFEDYVNLAYPESRYIAAWLTPTMDSWQQGDREVICILYDEKPITGSVRNSGK